MGRLLPPDAKGLEGGEFSGLEAMGDSGLLKNWNLLGLFGLFGVKSDGSGCKGAEWAGILFDSISRSRPVVFPPALKETVGSLLPLWSRSEAVDMLIIPLAFILSLKNTRILEVLIGLEWPHLKSWV